MEKLFIKSFVLVLALGFVSSAMAQESGFPTEEVQRSSENQPQQEEEWNVREGGMLMPEREIITPAEKSTELNSPVLSNNRNASSQKGKVQNNKPGQPEKTTQATYKEGEDESVLSFNFLYYLIQKFKFDAVE